MTAPILYV
jgi:nuclear cap-binding protein subunit 1